jgi:alkylated DNA repair dioxygenase AlkB
MGGDEVPTGGTVTSALFANYGQRHVFELSPGATVEYHPRWLAGLELMNLIWRLRGSVPFRQQKIRFRSPAGTITKEQPRLTAWYGDANAVYTYSGVKNKPIPWAPVLADLRDRVEAATSARYNSVLLNLYRDGKDSVAWHSDDEPELGTDPTIALGPKGAEGRRWRANQPDLPVGDTEGDEVNMPGKRQPRCRAVGCRSRRSRRVLVEGVSVPLCAEHNGITTLAALKKHTAPVSEEKIS